MEHVLLPLRRIIAEYAAEFEFVDFDPPVQKFMPLDALHKRPDFMKLLRENPGRIIHGAFHDVDHGEDASKKSETSSLPGDDRWIVEPRDDHKWLVLPAIPDWEQIREISEYSICIYATACAYALFEKNPALIKWVKVHLSKENPSCDVDLLMLSDQDGDVFILLRVNSVIV
jgi:hypothetical protein